MTYKDFVWLFIIIDEDELFEDRRLFELDKNIFSLECDRIKAEALGKGLTEDDIKHIDLELQIEIQDRLETIELIFQLTEELLLVILSRKLDIQSDIADYPGVSFDHGIVPLMNDYGE